MKELFKIKDMSFYEEDFLDEIEEYEDIIPIIQDLANQLDYERISCVEINECCKVSKDNYYIEIHGYINGEDEFITKEEKEKFENVLSKETLDLFVIRVYKCVDCGKWIIDILE
ncbi:hypothetical protein K5V21_06980 [Clostridium sardiniense]|uniref:Uncharacterized protein n=1 Tax=Clostridium sardiniense TaxID=29369 RepID=A0ABS7KWM5_CLOSR|nr:hypothetical protein [Clostridium sardiniense]MBY0755195.1 hypothetical protein [Clostridium sardiniense]MDQ0461143.1 hypothetical protein [Clostridium sardiniense]